METKKYILKGTHVILEKINNHSAPDIRKPRSKRWWKDIRQRVLKRLLNPKKTKPHYPTQYSIGHKRSGTLATDCVIGEPIRFIQWGKRDASNTVLDIRLTANENEYEITTTSSIQKMSIITDTNDKEFKQYLDS